jgi:hypothetical protein
LTRTVDLRAEIKLDDVVFVDDGVVASVRGPVRGDVVLAAPGGKRDAGFQSSFFDQPTDGIFQSFCKQMNKTRRQFQTDCPYV